MLVLTVAAAAAGVASEAVSAPVVRRGGPCSLPLRRRAETVLVMRPLLGHVHVGMNVVLMMGLELLLLLLVRLMLHMPVIIALPMPLRWPLCMTMSLPVPMPVRIPVPLVAGPVLRRQPQPSGEGLRPVHATERRPLVGRHRVRVVAWACYWLCRLWRPLSLGLLLRLVLVLGVLGLVLGVLGLRWGMLLRLGSGSALLRPRLGLCRTRSCCVVRHVRGSGRAVSSGARRGVVRRQGIGGREER